MQGVRDGGTGSVIPPEISLRQWSASERRHLVVSEGMKWFSKSEEEFWELRGPECGLETRLLEGGEVEEGVHD